MSKKSVSTARRPELSGLGEHGRIRIKAEPHAASSLVSLTGGARLLHCGCTGGLLEASVTGVTFKSTFKATGNIKHFRVPPPPK